MVHDVLIDNKLREENTEGIGTLTLVYNHHRRELEENLTNYRHHHLQAIVSTVHVHLNQHLCLEVLILRGKTIDIRKVADGRIATKGVQHGKLVLTTVA